jgi:DNA-binding transcriptional regulator YiaG
MSRAADRIPTRVDEVIHDLLPVVDGFSETLSTSKDVPPDARAVLDKVFERLRELGIDSVIPGADPYLTTSLAAGLARCYRALDADTNATRRELRVGAEQIRQALAYIGEESASNDDRTPPEIAAWLIRTVEVSDAELADTLGVAARTLRRWANGESAPSGEEAARLRILGRVVNNLRHSLTSPGVILWLNQPHASLKNKPPRELLDDRDAYQQLATLAARTRSHGAS